MRDIFKVPPAPFQLGKPSFQPVIAQPIKLSSRRLSNGSQNEPQVAIIRGKQHREDEVISESEQEERDNSYSIVKDSFVINSESDNEVITTLFNRIQDFETASQNQAKSIITPPPTNKKRKRDSLNKAHKSSSTSKKRKKSEVPEESIPPKKSRELDFTTSPEITSAIPQMSQSKRQRKEEKRKRKEEKAERKRRKAEKKRLKSELKDSLDSTVPDVHDEFVDHSFQQEQEIPSHSGDFSSLRELAEEQHREVFKGKPSGKKNRGHNLEIPATQESPSLAPTPRITDKQDHDSDKQMSDKITTTTPKTIAKPVVLISKRPRKVPNPLRRPPKTRATLSKDKIVDSSADEYESEIDHSESEHAEPQHAETEISEQVFDQVSEEETLKSGRRVTKKFSPEEDERLHRIVTQYKKVLLSSICITNFIREKGFPMKSFWSI